MPSNDLTTKDKLIRAARLIVAREGLSAATTAAIAAEAGLAEGTLYRHFPSKDDLLVEADRRLKVGVFGRVIEDKPGEIDLTLKLKRVWREIFDAYRMDPDGFVFGQRFAESPLADREAGQAMEFVTSALRQLHGQGLADGLFKDLPLDLMGNLFFGPIGYMLKTETKGRAWSEVELQAAAGAVLDAWRR